MLLKIFINLNAIAQLVLVKELKKGQLYLRNKK